MFQIQRVKRHEIPCSAAAECPLAVGLVFLFWIGAGQGRVLFGDGFLTKLMLNRKMESINRGSVVDAVLSNFNGV